MYKSAKLEEARFFYSHMAQTKENRGHFKYNLSAFLSSARSVLQYVRKEAAAKSGGQSWYDSQVDADKIVKFFRDKRDINIHVEPVSVTMDAHITMSATTHVAASMSLEIRDAEGNLKGCYESPLAPPKSPAGGSSAIETLYKFDDGPGSEDVLTLCKIYLTRIEAIVKSGRDKYLLV